MLTTTHPCASGLARIGTLALLAFAALAAAAAPAHAETAACSAAVPDAPWCGCAVASGAWPPVEDQGELVLHARRTLGAQTSCLKNGGQPYWQMQMFVEEPNNANAIAGLNPNIYTDFPSQAWCTETVAYWHYEARMPYLDGYRNPDWHPSRYVTSVPQMRAWYRAEEDLRDEGLEGRGRWIGGSELDYENFVPGVNGPCPGAYQALEAYDSTGGSWADSCHHSQVVDSVVVWRLGSADGPVQAVDVHVIEGNAGSGTKFVDVNGDTVKRAIVRDTQWYRNVIQYTRLGSQSLGRGNRRIRGWGIDLHADGTTYCDDGRLTTIVTPYILAYPAPGPPDEPDSIVTGHIVDYVKNRPGPISVTTNAGQVVTGGRLPGRDNHWLIPTGPLGVDPVYVQVDLRAEHPLPVKGVVIEWKGGIVPPQYQILWGGATGAPMSRTFAPASGGTPDPSTIQLPIPTAFGPAANYAVRYLRLAIPAFALVRPYEITGLHYLFDYGKDDDNGGVDDSPAYLDVAPGHGRGSLIEPSSAPNPFAARTLIAFELPGAATADVAIYDVAGRRVRSFRSLAGHAGRNEVAWDGLDDAGAQVRNGSYFVEVRIGNARGVRRVVLLR